MTSKELIEKANKAFENVKHKNYDKRSFFSGYLIAQCEQLFCPDCNQAFTKEELKIKEHCFNCGWEFTN